MRLIDCKICGKRFERDQIARKYCSLECRKAAQKANWCKWKKQHDEELKAMQ